MIILFGILLATIAAAIVGYQLWHQTYWRRRHVKGPRPKPIVGNMLPYVLQRKHFGEIYDDLYRSHEGAAYVGFYKFGVPSILVRSLDLTKTVLLDDFKSFQANDVHLEKHLDPLLSMNPFFVRGDEWKFKRSQLTPIFTAAKVKAIYPLVSDICNRFVEYIERNSSNGQEFEARMVCGGDFPSFILLLPVIIDK